jgi:hypothetical protein
MSKPYDKCYSCVLASWKKNYSFSAASWVAEWKRGLIYGCPLAPEYTNEGAEGYANRFTVVCPNLKRKKIRSDHAANPDICRLCLKRLVSNNPREDERLREDENRMIDEMISHGLVICRELCGLVMFSSLSSGAFSAIQCIRKHVDCPYETEHVLSMGEK